MRITIFGDQVFCCRIDSQAVTGAETDWRRVDPFTVAVAENNYGYLEIDWSRKDAELTFGIVDVKGTVRVEQKIQLSDLRFGLTR